MSQQKAQQNANTVIASEARRSIAPHERYRLSKDGLPRACGPRNDGIMRIGLYLLFFFLCQSTAYADDNVAFSISNLGQDFSSKVLQLLALVTVLSLAPSIVMMATSFTRIVVVLSFLRSALGLQQTPPNPVMIGLALFLTAFIMEPTFKVAYEKGIHPLLEEKISEAQAFEETVKPFKAFMLANTREKDLRLFFDLTKQEAVPTAEETPISIVVPAFMLSELRRAFEIGFFIFIPFLIIDMLVSSVLMAMGMMMLPPVMISLPFKLVFFVAIDGWYTICGSLVKSYVE